MVFNSLTYLLLLSVFVTLFWLISKKARYFLIFFSSLIFYGFWRVDFIPLLLFSTFADWWLSKKIYESNIDIYRKKLVILSLIINLGLLFVFKYLIFFSDNALGFLNYLGGNYDPITLKIILPLGISFYTFQTISYTIDVYRKIIKPENNFIIYGCYVTFFPQLIAGPILRAKEVIVQFKKEKKFNLDFIIIGLKRVLYGLFLKVVIADNIAPFVDTGFEIPIETLSALDVWTLAFLFGFQIYFDFSAYSHIAIGSARMIGIIFPENFNFPYLATSPKNFWQKWHISLSSWVRDYLYLPLAGEKFKEISIGGLGDATINKKDFKPLFITWGLMGLWHGANWTFLIWGIYHAVLIYFYRSLKFLGNNFNLKIKIFIGWFFTLPFIMLSWIPFRSQSLNDCFQMWLKILNPLQYGYLGLRENIYLITFLLLISTIITYFLKQNMFLKKIFPKIILLFSDLILIIFLFCLTFIFLRPINQFIYFQF